MPAPEAVYVPHLKQTRLTVNGNQILITEDDAGYLHADLPVGVAKVKHANQELVDNLPDQATWEDEAKAKAPKKSAEDQIRQALDAASPTATQEELVELATAKAVEIAEAKAKEKK